MILILIPVYLYALKNLFRSIDTKYGFVWMQPAVLGFDNFGTATYEDGVLYVPSKGDNNVYAIRASNGDIIWNRTCRQCDASPCIDGEVVYVCEGLSLFPRAMALSKSSGEVIWQFMEPSNSSWVGSPVVHDDYVYYTTYGSGVYALNKTNGDVIWHQDIGYLVCSPAYHEGFVSVSACKKPSGLYVFNATTGEEIWHVDCGESWESSPVVYEGMIVQVTFKTITRSGYEKDGFDPYDHPILSYQEYSTYVVNETNGEVLHEFKYVGSPSTPLVYDGKVIIPNGDGIWAFDLIDGQELWHTVMLHNGSFQDLSYCSPAASGGAIYYQSLNGTFYVINETDGSILWSYSLGGLGFGSPSIGDGYVFITNNFALYAFRIGSGSGDWPMFCQNNLHRSYSEHGIEHIELEVATEMMK